MKPVTRNHTVGLSTIRLFRMQSGIAALTAAVIWLHRMPDCAPALPPVPCLAFVAAVLYVSIAAYFVSRILFMRLPSLLLAMMFSARVAVEFARPCDNICVFVVIGITLACGGFLLTGWLETFHKPILMHLNRTR